MNSHELYNLVKHSKLAQVATPILKNIRGKSAVPTHQIIFTPKASAIRSNFGLKSTLPKQIGYSHIAFNDIDNYKNMPDVEKSLGKMHNRIKFQEIGVAVKSNPSQSLFELKAESNTTNLQILTEGFNVNKNVVPSVISDILGKNKDISRKFQKWLLKNHPEAILDRQQNQAETRDLLKLFLSEAEIVKKEIQLSDFTKTDAASSRFTAKSCVQGNAGFSYLQPGRLSNTPNGVRYGSVVPGRIVGMKEAAIGGFVSGVDDTSIRQPTQYAGNQGGRHTRQFNMPFMITGVKISNNGAVDVSATGVEAGSWMNNSIVDGGVKLNKPWGSRRVINEKRNDEDLATLFRMLKV